MRVGGQRAVGRNRNKTEMREEKGSPRSYGTRDRARDAPPDFIRGCFHVFPPGRGPLRLRSVLVMEPPMATGAVHAISFNGGRVGWSHCFGVCHA